MAVFFSLLVSPVVGTPHLQLGITSTCWPVSMEGALLVAKETNKNKSKKESFENSCNICASWVTDKYSLTWDHIFTELQNQEN